MTIDALQEDELHAVPFSLEVALEALLVDQQYQPQSKSFAISAFGDVQQALLQETSQRGDNIQQELAQRKPAENIINISSP
jgi:predicted phosphoribosyltransferase